jgi:catechol 2,3-dioxygenase-like lactoylglutathione lyase family enzyme
MPLGHLGINVADLERSRAYYRDLLPLLGFDGFLDNPDEFAWRPAGGKPGTYLFFYPPTESGSYSNERTGLQHLAFIVKTRQEVNAARDLAADLGSEIVHEPREWPEYPPPYYASFWLDPDGILLEAVCHHHH